MTNWRAVFDTNIFIAAALSPNPNSPTQELVDRWERAELTVLICEQLFAELVEKWSARGASPAKIQAQLNLIVTLAEWVTVAAAAIEPLLPDPDDNVVVACAVIGGAHYLVTYDPHFDVLGGGYRGVKIVKALPFLWAVRGETPRP